MKFFLTCVYVLFLVVVRYLLQLYCDIKLNIIPMATTFINLPVIPRPQVFRKVYYQIDPVLNRTRNLIQRLQCYSARGYRGCKYY